MNLFPFLKWAGGKRLHNIPARFPKRFRNYYEPFVGGMSVFLSSSLTHGFLSDANPDLIETYQQIRINPRSIMAELKELEEKHSKEHFFLIRDQQRTGENLTCSVPARTIYLNKTCYNGLWRVNKKGQFNTPIGSYKNPKIEVDLMPYQEKLAGVHLRHCFYKEAFEMPQQGDFVYLDPPFLGKFNQYVASGFDHEKFFDSVEMLHNRGVAILMSNSWDNRLIERFPEFNSEVIEVGRGIGKRQKEYLLWNYEKET